MERAWKLGEDLSLQDNLFDQITFEEVVMTVKANYHIVSVSAIRDTVRTIMENRMQDFEFLLDRNIDTIYKEVVKQRGYV